ncbi:MULTISPECIES: hypothetical protein [Meiothermus]|uniref:Uncharacterized protein n=2 Tax=Meiothermus TaxID=65551 RepID=D3PPY5_MEIRD|nr:MULTISPECIES: hypothetical protein [Meiothermus]ADD27611.1 hypothetical protein Mrub_0846 [Meiothermus ruber DSM 1279]AGK04076.1 hypothetical protein K649_03870 [Meiothermus ruber DSM 1279]MCL6531125.1 hypothetical protein [Meiothermus ruber]MCX7801743.1 hypothetical protein [Meiothermus ruber]RIH79645.1 hypothetical protein Mcate_00284 [Meiothermus taiwanensis]
MRTLLILALIAGGVYFYAERFGLAVGYAPFTPVFYWNYSGEVRNQIRATGIRAFVKVTVSGELRQGSFEVEIRRAGQNNPGLVKRYQGRFSEEIRYPAEANLYDVIFRIKDARGQVRMDWVAARNEF